MFIRELVYGTDAELDNFDTLTASLKHAVSDWKREIHRLIFGMYDLLYFDANNFKSLLRSAVDPEIFDRYRCDPTKVPHGEYSNDLVPAIRCHSWPRVASDFQSRPRKWPPQKVIEEIISSGFQVVARGCVVDPIPTKDFILSFSPSEAKLVDHLPPEAKSAYCLLKSCYKSVLGKEEGESRKALKSYHFKTALFWVAERTDPLTWQTINHLEGVRLIIDFLVDCLHGLNLPIYFVPLSNLFGGFSENDASTSISILMEIHRNPANFIKVLLDTEWEYTKITMVDDGSFEELRRDGGCFNILDWEAQLSLLMAASARAGNYPTDEMLDKPTTFFHSEEFRKRFIGDPFNTTPPGNIADIFGISEDQVDHVDVFVQSISQNNIDLFNILDLDISTDVSQYEENGIKEEIRQRYAKYDSAADQNFGKYFLAMTKLRLKFYANLFHFLTVKLLEACLLPATNAYKNKDVVYIINFLKLLTQKKNFDLDNMDDLLHYLLFFCHYTKERHHTLPMTDQILRSIREFLQDAKNLMTIYFNPRLIGPLPLDLGNRMVILLKECYPRQAKSTEQCCQM